MISAKRFSLLKSIMPLVFAGAVFAQLPPDTMPSKEPEDIKLPNGKSQKNEILKADHAKNLQDIQRIIELSTEVQKNLEKNEQFVFSLEDLKRLDEIEKITKRVRSRMKRF